MNRPAFSYLLFFLLFLNADLAPAQEASSPSPAYGDTLLTSMGAEPSNLIPFLASDSASAAVSGLLFNGLVKYDKDLKLVGDLAAGWEIKENGRLIVFHLRKDVRWQDGAPFTAEDVEFTFQKLSDPQVPTPYASGFEKVKSLKIVDPHTVEVRYKEPFSPGLASWAMGLVPKHLLAGEDLLKTNFSRRPVGTGPYFLKTWKSGEYLELWANGDYFEGSPFIGRVIYRIIPDQSTAFLELQTGSLDLFSLSPLQYKRQTDGAFLKANYAKFRMTSFGYTYLGYNLRHGLFSDPRVRRAIGLAIPKNQIVEVTLLGMGRVLTGPFLPTSWAYNRSVPETPFDPMKAKQLLAEAGFADTDGDGYLDKDGRPLSFTVLTHSANDQRKMACEIIQKSLDRIGVRMKIQVVEWGVLLKEFIDKKNFEAVMLGWNLSPDPDLYEIFHSSQASPGRFNFVSYENPEVDRLLEQGRRLFSEEDRARVYHRVHAILNEEEPYTFLYVAESLPMVHRRFREVEPTPTSLMHNFIRWFVPEKEQKYLP